MTNYKPVLVHHGILGQKWGERRFQYEDGTLTSEGKRRYGKDRQLSRDYQPQKVSVKPKTLKGNSQIQKMARKLNFTNEVSGVGATQISSEMYEQAIEQLGQTSVNEDIDKSIESVSDKQIKSGKIAIEKTLTKISAIPIVQVLKNVVNKVSKTISNLLNKIFK